MCPAARAGGQPAYAAFPPALRRFANQKSPRPPTSSEKIKYTAPPVRCDPAPQLECPARDRSGLCNRVKRGEPPTTPTAIGVAELSERPYESSSIRFRSVVHDRRRDRRTSGRGRVPAEHCQVVGHDVDGQPANAD